MDMLVSSLVGHVPMERLDSGELVDLKSYMLHEVQSL